MNNSRTIWIIVIIALVALVCCICVALTGILGLSIFNVQSNNQGSPPFALTMEIPDFPGFEPTPRPTVQVVRPTPQPGQSLNGAGQETLETLEGEVVPFSSLLELAERLEGKDNIPETMPGPPAPLTTGTRETFKVTNVDTNDTFETEAVLRYVTENVYFWIEDGVVYDEGDLRDLTETFQDEIYPTNREFFGSEWNPGVDNDPHLYILYTGGLGFSLGGYYSSADEYHPLAHENSNSAEMFVINSDNVMLDEEFAYSVLAHEFQHMIHWYGDRNEESWLNEGFSVLAEFLNGYTGNGAEDYFAQDPDLQLNDWPNDSDATFPHYGAGHLFLSYFLDRFGDDMTKALVAEESNGMVSVDTVLLEADTTDPLTGAPIGADDFFADWVVTNYLKDPQVGDGRFAYQTGLDFPQLPLSDEAEDCPANISGTVSQYGADYIRLACQGTFTLNFQGSTEVGVLPEDPYSGSYAFWSNKGDESDMTLTQSFDFSGVSGPLSLSFQTWYDIEEDYDYVYLLARPDGGDWQILTTPSGTPDDPTGNSYGWGYNGVTSGWIEEVVDLSDFAGEQVELRFEYVTDAAVNGEGFLLDDVSIPEIGYTTDFETDEGGWVGEGFVRIQNALPQTYRVTLISFGSETTVTPLEIAPDQTASLPIQIGGDVDEIVVVVSGTTRFTRQPAAYVIEVE